MVAFLTGIGSIVGGFWALKAVHKQDRNDCLERIEELRREFDRGRRVESEWHDSRTQSEQEP